jgi:hypothetical protein
MCSGLAHVAVVFDAEIETCNSGDSEEADNNESVGARTVLLGGPPKPGTTKESLLWPWSLSAPSSPVAGHKDEGGVQNAHCSRVPETGRMAI